jgi:hypothetical protein
MDTTASETNQNRQLRNRRRVAWAVLFLLTLAVLAAVVIPVGLIMPFKAQSPRGLAIAYSLRRWSPSLTLVAALAALALVVWLWRGTRWWRKPALILALLLTLTATWFARQNHFEWMFNPLPNPAYAKINDASFMTDPDMLLAVEHNGEAAAYPVRLMAYHHVIQDVVGGTPLVATY